ncbi:hypothetical protein M0802_007711 [Mischocyttarus mexicanus]|nr:hypothetical protein M0802_007711 [Mischocyttarus mexicanus]
MEWSGLEKVAVVTGASSGIGKAIAELLVSKGLKVIGIARSIDKLEALSEELKSKPGKLLPLQCDLTNQNEIHKAIEWIEKGVGSVNILINNAALNIDSGFSNGEIEDWEKILDLNIIGLTCITKEILKLMKKKGIDNGCIVNINDTLGLKIPANPERPASPAYICRGAVGGLSVVLVGHPFDTIKVQLQMSPGVYRGMFHVVTTLVTKEGPFSLYKGISAPLAAVVPLSAIGFFSYGAGKLLVSQPGQTKHSDLQLILSGMFSGVCTTIVAAPGERVKCLLQAQKLLKEGGIRNLYLGTGATLLRDMPSCATYFYCYERIATWLVSLPADSIKTRLQISPMGTYPRGVRSVLPIIMKEGGFLGLYRGLVPVLIRAFLANAACFYGLEFAFNVMDKFTS